MGKLLTICATGGLSRRAQLGGLSNIYIYDQTHSGSLEDPEVGNSEVVLPSLCLYYISRNAERK
jgi:hypothetical protein